MRDLIDELHRWQEDGRRVSLWWRDDDAVADTPALRRLVRLAEIHDAPLALAVIPAGAKEELVGALNSPAVTVVQHGYAHRNHALPGGRAVECGGDRGTDAILAEFGEGRERLGAAFEERFVPVMVPPWNRIEPRVTRELSAHGYGAVSVFGPAADNPEPADMSFGLPVINAHLDVLAWKGGARFAGYEKLVRLAAERLADRRLARTSPDEPFGLLTHHLDHDDATWAFLSEILPVLSRHPAVSWKTIGDLVAEPAEAK